MSMNRMRIAGGAALLTVLLALGALAQAHGGPHHKGDFPGGPGMAMFRGLDLTDAQHTQIKQIYASAKPSMRPLWQQEMQSHDAMMKLITSGAFDQAKAQAIADQMSQVHAQIELQHAQLTSQAYQVLTADQKAKMADLMTQRQQRFQQHMQRHQESGAEQAPN